MVFSGRRERKKKEGKGRTGTSLERPNGEKKRGGERGRRFAANAAREGRGGGGKRERGLAGFCAWSALQSQEGERKREKKSDLLAQLSRFAVCSDANTQEKEKEESPLHPSTKRKSHKKEREKSTSPSFFLSPSAESAKKKERRRPSLNPTLATHYRGKKGEKEGERRKGCPHLFATPYF